MKWFLAEPLRASLSFDASAPGGLGGSSRPNLKSEIRNPQDVVGMKDVARFGMAGLDWSQFQDSPRLFADLKNPPLARPSGIVEPHRCILESWSCCCYRSKTRFHGIPLIFFEQQASLAERGELLSEAVEIGIAVRQASVKQAHSVLFA